MGQLQAMLPSHNVSSKHAHSAFTVISQPWGASWTCCHASHDMCLTHSVVSASWTWVCVCLHSRLPVAASINLVFLWTSTGSYLLYLMVSAFICLTAFLSPTPPSDWQFIFSRASFLWVRVRLLPGFLFITSAFEEVFSNSSWFVKFLGNIPSKLLVHKANYLYNIITIINTNNLK